MIKLTDDEECLIAANRAMLEYVRALAVVNRGRDKPREQLVYIQQHSDTSGRLLVEDADLPRRSLRGGSGKHKKKVGNGSGLTIAVWSHIGEAAAKIESSILSLRDRHPSQGEKLARALSGDPRKGRKVKPVEDCDGGADPELPPLRLVSTVGGGR